VVKIIDLLLSCRMAGALIATEQSSHW